MKISCPQSSPSSEAALMVLEVVDICISGLVMTGTPCKERPQGRACPIQAAVLRQTGLE